MTTLSNKSGIRTKSQESVLFSWEHTTHAAVRPGKLWQKVAKNTSSQELVLYNALQQGLHLCLTEWLCWAEASFWLSEECGHPYATRNKQKRKGREDLRVTGKFFISCCSCWQIRSFSWGWYHTTLVCPLGKGKYTFPKLSTRIPPSPPVTQTTVITSKWILASYSWVSSRLNPGSTTAQLYELRQMTSLL